MKFIAAHRQQIHIIQPEAYIAYAVHYSNIFRVYYLLTSSAYMCVYVNVCTNNIDANSHMNRLNSHEKRTN